MKNKFDLIIVMIVLSLMNACKKDETADVSTIVKVSYPEIQLKGAPGDSIVFVAKGGTYTEAGAILIDDITHAQSDVFPDESGVNTDSIGLYTITYKAHNSNGFETTKNRFVAVYNPAINPEDYTGSYSHNNGQAVTVTQSASRLFSCDDIYGTFTIAIPGYFVDLGDILYIPKQPIDPSLGSFIYGDGLKSGAAGTYVLDFQGLIRDGLSRPRTFTQI